MILEKETWESWEEKTPAADLPPQQPHTEAGGSPRVCWCCRPRCRRALEGAAPSAMGEAHRPCRRCSAGLRLAVLALAPSLASVKRMASLGKGEFLGLEKLLYVWGQGQTFGLVTVTNERKNRPDFPFFFLFFFVFFALCFTVAG